MNMDVARELHVMINAQHPNLLCLARTPDGSKDGSAIPQVYWDGRTLHQVMDIVEKVDGCETPDLFSYVIDMGPLSEKDLAKVVHQVASALLYLNRDLGSMHRDMKPENVCVDKNALFDCVKVCDYGLSRTFLDGGLDASAQKGATANRGTVGYMAPEMIDETNSSKPIVYSPKVDVWSLGVTMFACMRQALPFTLENTPSNIRNIKAGKYPRTSTRDGPGCTRGSIKLLERMLTVDPDKRISMAEVLEDRWLVDTISKR